MKKKIYLAGPEVFDQNAIEIGKKLVKKCKKVGLKGLFPLDNVVKGNSKSELSKAIFIANREMIEQSDYVVANINSWRGSEPDSGTIWEIGYALGLGKTVFGYIDSPENSYLDKFDTNDIFALQGDREGEFVDSLDMVIEDFDNPVNLMIAESMTICSSFKECIKKISKL